MFMADFVLLCTFLCSPSHLGVLNDQDLKSGSPTSNVPSFFSQGKCFLGALYSVIKGCPASSSPAPRRPCLAVIMLSAGCGSGSPSVAEAWEGREGEGRACG